MIFETLIKGAIAVTSALSANDPACVAAREELPLPPALRDVEYIRVHPSGDFILASLPSEDPASVVIVDLRRRGPDGRIQPEIVPTPLRDEAYPVEPTWDLIVSPGNEGSRSTQYFSFSDVLQQGRGARPLTAEDVGLQFYHSASELPGRTANGYSFRTLLWQNNQIRDDNVRLGARGEPTAVAAAAAPRRLCGGAAPGGEDRRVAERFDALALRVSAVASQGSGSTLREVLRSGGGASAVAEYREIHGLAHPVLSRDGREIAGLNAENRLTVYELSGSGETCRPVAEIPYQTSLVTFGPATPQRPALLAFAIEDQREIVSRGRSLFFRGVYVLDRRNPEDALLVSKPNETFASYPGFTADQRLIYLSRERDRRGERWLINRVDLNQIFNLGPCARRITSPATPAGSAGSTSTAR